MKQTSSKPVPLADGTVRYRVRIEYDPSPELGALGEHAKLELLRLLAATPGLLACGPKTFNRLFISYNGSAWVADMEAVVEAS